MVGVKQVVKYGGAGHRGLGVGVMVVAWRRASSRALWDLWDFGGLKFVR